MPKSLFDAKKFRAAMNIPAEAENAVALTVGKFDPNRWPNLTFSTFAINSVIAAVSPDCSFRFLKAAIDSAKKTLLLYIYDISAPYMIELLANAKKRKVKIRGMYDASMGTGVKELAALKTVCIKGGVKAAPSGGDRNVFTVCHQKFMVIDGKTVVVESANWAKSSIPQSTTVGQFKKANREWFVRFDDTKIADWFAKLFQLDFDIAVDAGLAVAAQQPPPPGVAMLAAVTPPSNVFDFETVADSGATVIPVVSPDNYLPKVKALLKSATKSIYLQQQYILAGKGVKDLLMEIAKKREVDSSFDVRIITSATFPENWEKTKATLDSFHLLKDLKAINPKSFVHCHNKGVIVDGESVVISSTNLSENSILRAREAGVLVNSKKIAKYYQDVFLVDWKDGLKAGDVDAHLTVLDGADSV